MKFNVLVVAAMVITSVSAGRKGKSNKPVKKSGGDSMSAPSYNPLEAGEGTSQESDPNETGPAGYSGDDGADKNSASNSVMAHVMKKLTKTSKKTVTDPVLVCDNLVTELYFSKGKIWDLDYQVRSMFPDLYKLTTAKNSNFRNTDIDNWRESHPEATTVLAKMIKEITDLMEKHHVKWAIFAKSCQVQSFMELFLEEMIKKIHFAKWCHETTQAQGTDEINLMTFDK
ncbi:hypothetical protein BASA81_014357 [Batrachochytrium salamandrivorans]|nr:hypothetical protein BASA81_014357 [Batrachochytrium salamandrivorans]